MGRFKRGEILDALIKRCKKNLDYLYEGVKIQDKGAKDILEKINTMPKTPVFSFL